MRDKIPLRSAHIWRVAPVGAVLIGIVFVALALRVSLVVAFQHRPTHDTLIFVNWAHLLMQYGRHGLYAHVDTIDHFPVNYPPGYALLLGAVTAVFTRLGSHGSDSELGALLKLPAVIADLVLCGVVYGVARRWTDARRALVAPLIAAFAPFTWPISALWGQVDSICATFMVAAFALSSSRRYTLAWIAIALAVLVKPLPIVVVPLLAVVQIRAGGISLRSVGGPIAGIVLAYLAALPFAPTASPPGVFEWLGQEYLIGQSLGHATSINAYNVWTLASGPVSDLTPLLGIELHTWGWLAVIVLIAATTLALAAQVTMAGADRLAREQAAVRAWFLVLYGFFIFSTRMHERYVLFALALTPLLWYCGRLERAVAVTSITAFVACVVLVLGFYEHGIVGEIVPLTRTLSFVNLVVFALFAVRFFRASAGTRRADLQIAVRESP